MGGCARATEAQVSVACQVYVSQVADEQRSVPTEALKFRQ